MLVRRRCPLVYVFYHFEPVPWNVSISGKSKELLFALLESPGNIRNSAWLFFRLLTCRWFLFLLLGYFWRVVGWWSCGTARLWPFLFIQPLQTNKLSNLASCLAVFGGVRRRSEWGYTLQHWYFAANQGPSVFTQNEQIQHQIDQKVKLYTSKHFPWRIHLQNVLLLSVWLSFARLKVLLRTKRTFT